MTANMTTYYRKNKINDVKLWKEIDKGPNIAGQNKYILDAPFRCPSAISS